MHLMKRFIDSAKQRIITGKILESIGKRWTLLLIVSLVLCQSAKGGLGIFIQLYLKKLGVQPLIISLTTSVSSLGVLLGSVFWGMLSDYRAKKHMMFVILAAAAAAIGVLALLPPASGVLISTFVRSFMFAGLAPITMAIISGASTVETRGRKLSYIASSQSLGWMLGSILVGCLLDGFGFKWTALTLASLPILSLTVLFCLPQKHFITHTPAKRSSYFNLLLTGGLGRFYSAHFLRQAGITGMFSLIFAYMASLGIPVGSIGMANAVCGSAQVAGLLIFGHLADRLGRKIIFLIGFGLSVLAPLLFVLTKNVWEVTAAFFVLGMAFGASYIGSTAHIGDRVPLGYQGTMLGLFESTRGLGGIVGPIAAGAIVSVTGFRGMFITMAGITALGLILASVRGDKAELSLVGGEATPLERLRNRYVWQRDKDVNDEE